MAAITFFAPILPGKLEDWRQAVSEMIGPRRNEFDDFCHRMGITREFASLQSTPDGDFVVIYIEADEPDTVNDRIMASDHPFDRWITENIFEPTHGMDASQPPPPPNEVIVDWRA
ncbi:MAG: hypothetical protein QF554_10060 [Dehalococcoidia bacterium]|jgi:hypothetical protein|nr:hypothetical protein [Dehalococcoidia bacterium]